MLHFTCLWSRANVYRLCKIYMFYTHSFPNKHKPMLCVWIALRPRKCLKFVINFTLDEYNSTQIKVVRHLPLKVMFLLLHFCTVVSFESRMRIAFKKLWYFYLYSIAKSSHFFLNVLVGYGLLLWRLFKLGMVCLGHSTSIRVFFSLYNQAFTYDLW